MKTGLIHAPTPSSIPLLGTAVDLASYTIPDRIDWVRTEYAAPTGDELGNDHLGCCVEVAPFEAIRIRRANAQGSSWRPALPQILFYYNKWGGYDPTKTLPDGTNPTDKGTDPNVAMASWCRNGIQIDSQNEDVPFWASIPPCRPDLLKAAIALTGPVQASFNLPLAWQTRTYPHSLWGMQDNSNNADWEPGSWDPHRVVICGYTEDEYLISTWGMLVYMSQSALVYYCLALDATLSHEWIDASSDLSPSHVNWDQLKAALPQLEV